MKEAVEKAKHDQAHLVVFPELFLTGYLVAEHMSELAEDEKGVGLTAMKKLCQTYQIHAVVSFPEKGEEN